MARILLIDSDEPHANALSRAIERRGHEVSVLQKWMNVGALLGRSLASCDVVVLDCSANRVEDWAALHAIAKWTATHVPRPQVLCLSRVQKEPAVRIEIERHGARFLHER